MIVASGVSMQFGPQVLFTNVTVKFGGGNRYGLIGANGSGKSTFMKILATAVRRNEAEALRVVEPLHGTCCHFRISLR